MPSTRLLPLLPLLCLFSICSAAGPAALAQQPASDLSKEYARKSITALYEQQATVTDFSQASISPDGTRVAWASYDPKSNIHRVEVAPVADSGKASIVSAGIEAAKCNNDSPAWSPDGRYLAFLSDCRSAGQQQLFVVDMEAKKQAAQQLTRLSGYVSQVQWAPDSRQLAFLYVEKASRTPSPMAAENRLVGVIDDVVNSDVQRIAVARLGGRDARLASPAGLYVFEFEWSPDGRSFAYTAASPPGDDNWYVAKLFTQPVERPEAVAIYQPKLQIALPRWSPGGKSIGFIEGLMSDEGGTGGEIYQVALEGGEPRNLTPGRKSTPSWFSWRSDSELLFTEFVGGSTAISKLRITDGKTETLWEKGETIHASPTVTSISLSTKGTPLQVAFVRTSWDMLPEVWAGPIDSLKQVTRANAGVTLPRPRSENILWQNGGSPVQGWLLFPEHYNPSLKYPMVVSVHGGPAWISTPTWRDDDFNATLFPGLGYFILVPNVRGSYGQGEKFTQANRREWGFGDLDDMVAGVDEVVRRFPVDTNRVGVMGWSYGGSTSMMAVARTHRFRAAVAGAGAVNMLSYYGENSIDQWMLSYFGASAYDDPEAYARCSAITYVKNAKTPTLILVGERDGEAPPPQSFEFWHALKELKVPTRLIVYADEGHGFSKPEDRIDLSVQAFAWFEQYMKAD